MSAEQEYPGPLDGEWLDTFAGSGGWDHVAQEMGMRVGGAENAEPARKTRDAAGLETVASDVREIETKPGDYVGQLGSPPCTTFAMQGNGNGRKFLSVVLAGVESYRVGSPMTFAQLSAATGDDRTALVLEPLRLALEGEPVFIAWEQAREVLPVWQACAVVLRDRGYSVVTGKLYAEQYGAPQTRERAVLIARRDGVPARLPAPTHARRGDSTSPLPAPAGFAKALGLPVDTVMVSNYGTGGDPRNRGRRTGEEPSATITSKGDRMKLHIPDGAGKPCTMDGCNVPACGVRNLTLEEAARLQGFPDRYPFQGTKSEIGLQIGNAVPGYLARAVLSVFAQTR